MIPPGALDKVRRGESVALEVYVDGSDPNFAFQAQAALRKTIDGMPRFFQLLSHLVPARYLIGVLRGVMLKGVGFAVLWPHLAALLLFSALVLFLASVRFQRQVVA